MKKASDGEKKRGGSEAGPWPTPMTAEVRELEP